MKTTNCDVPDDFKIILKKSFLDTLARSDSLDSYEISLFEWYSKENSKLIDDMTVAEHAFLEEQKAAGVDEINDSGLITIEYYIKRARYADVIYLASLLESYLDRICKKITLAIGEERMLFSLDELSGDKWSKRRKFIEKYCGFLFDMDHWSQLEVLTTIRNNLVHDNGSVLQISKNNITKIQSMPGIDISRSEVVIEDTYIRHCLAEFRFLTNFLDENVRKFIHRCKHPGIV